METKRVGAGSVFPGMCFGVRHGLSVVRWQLSQPRGRGGHCPCVTHTPSAAKCLERLAEGQS